jgi:hypothetical protein
MSNINEFITNVTTSRKRTGILYCSGLFYPVIQQFEKIIPEIKFLDCTKLYKNSLTFSASDLLNLIEFESKDTPTIVSNIETFIVSNSHNFSDQISRILILKEPLKPLFFFFYSKNIYRQFKDHYETKELNCHNIIEVSFQY